MRFVMMEQKDKQGLSGKHIRQIAAPLLVLYLFLYALMLQDAIDQHSKLMLGIQLTLGILVLGAYPWYRIQQDFGSRIGITLRELDWRLLVFSVLTALVLQYVRHYTVLNFPSVKLPNFYLYYGGFSIHSPDFVVLPLLMTGYVLAEEIFFRGLVYQRLKDAYGLVVAALFSVGIFTFAHLNGAVFIVLILLTLLTIALFERTGTLFYGFVTHAVLNIWTMLMVTEELGLGGVFLDHAPLKFAVLSLLSLMLGVSIFSRTGRMARLTR